MAALENYSEKEWEAISATPQLVGLAMTGAGASGIIGSTKEMFASASGMMNAKTEYSSNALIQAIIPNTTDASKALEDAKKQRTVLMDMLKSNNIKSQDQLTEMILTECKSVITILENKETPEVVSDYKKWVLEIAEKVANAAKEGSFLGFGGERFSENEQALFEKLKIALA